MDPTVCLINVLDALAAGERDDAIDALEDLTEWLRQHGYMPSVKRAIKGYLAE